MDVQQVKQRFGIIGNSPLLNRGIDIVMQVAPTDLSVLVTGESGTGKEVMPQIIHSLSARKHGKYIAVNCGAIPEGTIDSELFGHEKGSFTGATESRKGYFEVADGGTIFLDEVAELPLQTQVRLLRVLETGEFIKVGSSKVLKTNVRIIAATNINIPEAVKKGKFREDLFYRLNTVPIHIPPLRKRKEDIYLLFRKFATDCATKYRMPSVKLTEDAVLELENYRWPGNIRQLKNITEQICVIETKRDIDEDTLLKYIPDAEMDLTPAIVNKNETANNFAEREILYKILFDLKREVADLKSLVLDMVESGSDIKNMEGHHKIIDRLSSEENSIEKHSSQLKLPQHFSEIPKYQQPEIKKPEVEEVLTIADQEKRLIIKALDKYKGKRKNAAQELGISERTLYRKIKEYDLG